MRYRDFLALSPWEISCHEHLHGRKVLEAESSHFLLATRALNHACPREIFDQILDLALCAERDYCGVPSLPPTAELDAGFPAINSASPPIAKLRG